MSAQQRTGLYKALSARGWRTKEPGTEAAPGWRGPEALSARGWRTREPLSEELSLEQPRLVERVGQALVDRALGLDEVAAIAGAGPGRDYLFFLPRQRLAAV